MRTLAYCLSFEEGIAFSKGGLSTADEPPISIHDPTGVLIAWIDVGAPSAERLHRASKAARRVSLFTTIDLQALLRETRTRPIHKLEEIAVWQISSPLLDSLEPKIEKRTKLEIVRNGDELYVTAGPLSLEGKVVRLSLAEP